MTDVDLLLRAGAMLPMTDRSVVYDGLVAVKDGRIIFAGPARDAADQYSAARTIHNPDAVLRPDSSTLTLMSGRTTLARSVTRRTSSPRCTTSGSRWR